MASVILGVGGASGSLYTSEAAAKNRRAPTHFANPSMFSVLMVLVFSVLMGLYM